MPARHLLGSPGSKERTSSNTWPFCSLQIRHWIQLDWELWQPRTREPQCELQFHAIAWYGPRWPQASRSDPATAQCGHRQHDAGVLQEGWVGGVFTLLLGGARGQTTSWEELHCPERLPLTASSTHIFKECDHLTALSQTSHPVPEFLTLFKHLAGGLFQRKEAVVPGVCLSVCLCLTPC